MLVLVYQKKLVEKYNYNILPSERSKRAREIYRRFLPEIFSIDGERESLFSLKDTLISNGYDRIVIGDYGAYIEFDKSDINWMKLELQDGEEYRYNDPFYRKRVKYIWYTARDDSGIKIYHQQKRVPYADYLVGKFYVSPYEVKKYDAKMK